MAAVNRREILAAGARLGMAVAGLGAERAFAAPAAATERLGPPQPFDFARLSQRAKALAGQSYKDVKSPAADTIAKIDFDVVQKIKFRADRALWRDEGAPFPIRLFHVDKFNPLPVQINIVAEGMARRVVYATDDFDYGGTGLETKLPSDLGYSGFRIMDGQSTQTDWLAFQGASYFRSAGQENQYGISARGIAVDTALSRKEEFPRFVEFWLAQSERERPSVDIYALLDGPSLTGAYRFVATKQTGAIIDVQAALFMRNDIARLGIAPLTSMYWFGENERQNATDWRPEIHDSDGLALWTGKGERIWRPLINPPSVNTNSFLDEKPKGFGLMQRDRRFENYQDDGAFYNRRPSIWVEPFGDWGAGAVQLVEIPTQDEIHDNVVAYWIPKKDVKAGSELTMAYRLHWRDDDPKPPTDIARVVATRVGRGGVPGRPAPDDKESWKFVIDFVGGPLANMAARFDIKPMVNVSRGKVNNAYVIKVVGTDRWRALFDVHAPKRDRIDLRCFLSLDDKALTETWLYQFFPPAG